MPETGMDPRLQRLFTNVTQDAIVKKGNLINFGYQRWIHDPYPLIIVADMIPGERIRGVNLHYLSFFSIKGLLNDYANNPTFGYPAIKGKPLVDAFRTYKWGAIRQLKKLDSDFILKVMQMVRSFDPADVENIRQTVTEQVRRQVNPTAAEMTQRGVAGPQGGPATPGTTPGATPGQGTIPGLGTTPPTPPMGNM